MTLQRLAMTATAVAALAGLGLAGCTLEPKYARPTPAVPTTWPVGAAYPEASAESAAAVAYADIFKDPHLRAIVDQALANNQDLRAALANVDLARAQYQGTRADLFPHVDAGVLGVESRSQAGAVASNGTTNLRTDVTRNFNAEISLSSFEIDLFGRLRSLSHAAQDAYLATEQGAQAARLTLVGEVARAYLTLAADRSLLAIAVDTEANASRSVALTKARLEGGVAPRTDLSQAQTILEQASADKAALVTLVAQDRNALQLLVGAPLADGELPASIESVDGLLGEAPAGLSSEVLLKRPDVAEAELRLRAANAEIGAARAAFFPRISLTGFTGLASRDLTSLFSNGGNWEVQAGATLPLFAGGANVANLAAAKAQREIAVATYQKSVQTAFREVSDALARRGTIRDQVAAQDRLVSAADTSYRLSLARYRQGVDPYLSTLDAQRTLYSARRTAVTTRLTQATNLVDLYQTLGGGLPTGS